MYNSRLLDKYIMKQHGIWPKIGKKPKKGDRIKDNLTGEVHEIDMVSRGYAYTKPKKGSIERLPFALSELKPDKNQNMWIFWD